MTIKIEQREGDDAGYIQLVQELVTGTLRESRVDEAYITRIDNWFDHKWLKFSGKRVVIQGAKSTSAWSVKLGESRQKELTLPPFSPNRVLEDDRYLWNAYSNEFVLGPSGDVLHPWQSSWENLDRRITNFGSSTAFVWFTGNTELNGRGSLMVYLSRDGETEAWFAGLVRDGTWKVQTLTGISHDGVEALAEQGRTIHREARERVLPEEEALSRELHRAIRNSNLGRVSELIAGDVDLEGRNEFGNTALTAACAVSAWDCAELLLTAGSNPYQQGYRGGTALHYCAFGPASEPIVERIVTKLIERGVDVDARNQSGHRPLMATAWAGCDSIARLLLEASADVNAVDGFRWTALTLACIRGHADMARLLLEHGAKVGIRDKQRGTPMFAAARDGQIECIELLHAAGASVDLKDKSGWTPLARAKDAGHTQAAALLKRLGG